MTTTEMSPAQVLEDAADLLLIHGRCTGQGKSDDGRLCVLGAMTLAAGGDLENWADLDLRPPAVAALRSLAPRLTTIAKTQIEKVYLWNDDRDTTDDDVRDTLLVTAKDIRNEAVPS